MLKYWDDGACFCVDVEGCGEALSVPKPTHFSLNQQRWAIHWTMLTYESPLTTDGRTELVEFKISKICSRNKTEKLRNTNW